MTALPVLLLLLSVSTGAATKKHLQPGGAKLVACRVVTFRGISRCISSSTTCLLLAPDQGQSKRQDYDVRCYDAAGHPDALAQLPEGAVLLQLSADDEDVLVKAPPLDVCGGCRHGHCSTATRQCVCRRGFRGALCASRHGVCFDGKHAVECGDHGRCVDGQCICSHGYTGLQCKLAPCPNDCSDNGLCYHTPTGDHRCICLYGTSGHDCSASKCLSGCSGHGSCRENATTGELGCYCDVGWTGSDCAQPTCPECTHGFCDPVSFQCLCQAGWAGAECSTRACPGGCSDKGVCLSTGACLCDVPYLGTDCSVDGRVCPHNCTGRGLCLEWGCRCKHPYSGPACADISCDPPCLNDGICEQGKCYCKHPFTGAHCQTKLCPNQCSGNGVCIDGKCQCHTYQPRTRVDAKPGRALLTHSRMKSRTLGPVFINTPFAKPGHADPGSSMGVAPPALQARQFFGDDCSQLPCLGDCGEQAKLGKCDTATGLCMCVDGSVHDGCMVSQCNRTCSGHGICVIVMGVDPASVETLWFEAAEQTDDEGWNTRRHPKNKTKSAAQPTHQCLCDRFDGSNGWTGSDCEVPLCPDDCSAGLVPPQGACTADGCVCEEAYFGDSCEHLKCPVATAHHKPSDWRDWRDWQWPGGDVLMCAGHGFCVRGKCACKQGWGGEACEVRTCPNACNEHGVCLSDGSCDCAAGYDGVDCGQGTGPIVSPQDACANRCSGRGVCHNGECLCEAGKFHGADCSLLYCPRACSKRGTCDERTGHCHCHAGFTGPDCMQEWCKPADCNQRGTCSLDTDGEPFCQCTPSYDGSSCQDVRCDDAKCANHGRCLNDLCFCDPAWTGLHCEVEKCPGNCTGHGTCSLYEVIVFGRVFPTDKVQGSEGCQCFPGWSGADCSVGECSPSPTCSQHGQCEPGESQEAVPRCRCDVPWAGPDCAAIRCRDTCSAHGECFGGECHCNPGWIGPRCDAPACPANCTQHGRCNSRSNPLLWDGAAEGCVCASGYSGADCSVEQGCRACDQGQCLAGVCVCDAGWQGANCNISLCNCHGHGRCGGDEFGRPMCYCQAPYAGSNCTDILCSSNCSNHGECRDFVCHCDQGWSGDLCQTPLADFCPGNCSGHGRCNTPLNPLAWVTFDNNGCECDVGFTKRDCSEVVNCSAIQCGHGQCENGACLCDAGWVGANCSTSLCQPPDCSGHGVCAGDAFGRPECHCEFPYTGGNCSQVDCSFPCSLHGQCRNFACHCEAGWRGALCDEWLCPEKCSAHLGRGKCNDPDFRWSYDSDKPEGCLCEKGWTGPSCLAPACDAPACGPEGECALNAKGERYCKCSSTHAGPACLQLRCSNACNRHGQCIDFVCKCDDGFAGETCEEELCPNQCSGNGRCVLPGHQRELVPKGGGHVLPAIGCLCDTGYSGRDCSVEAECDGLCAQHGHCDKGVCVCDAGWAGDLCQQSLCEPSDCSGNGVCGGDSYGQPVCLCEYPYLGKACHDVACSFDCSQHGRCHNFQCHCEVGWAGLLCERRACPNHCSAPRGFCNSRSHPHGPQVPFDASLPEGCVCGEQWQGDDCSEPRCLGCVHGQCALVGAPPVPQCVCEAGWTGATCSDVVCTHPCSQHGTCVNYKCQCEPGWEGTTCAVAVCSPPCAAGGRCTHVNGVHVCQCEHSFSGPECANIACSDTCSGHGHCIDAECWCQPEFRGRHCEREVCPLGCSGRGHCNNQMIPWAYAPEHPEGCRCAPGWGGKGCELTLCLPACQNGGTCVPAELGPERHKAEEAAQQRAQGQGHLYGMHDMLKMSGLSASNQNTQVNTSLDPASPLHISEPASRKLQKAGPQHTSAIVGALGSNITRWPQATCQCPFPFFGPACSRSGCASSCSGHGQCFNQQCHCLEGWTGPACEERLCPDDCLPNGRCNQHGEEDFAPSSPAGCICNPGWTGKACRGRNHCFPSCRHGVCVDGLCVCDAGWYGLVCDNSLCDPPDCSGRGTCGGDAFGLPMCHCDAQWGSQTCALKRCALPCDHGECLDDRCVCQPGWRGDLCSVSICPMLCSGHGRCNSRLHAWSYTPQHAEGCLCLPGWTGLACEQALCPGGPCLNGGKCIETDRGLHVCVCTTPWTDAVCGQRGCLDSCSGRGSCVASACHCSPAWHGDSCQHELCPNRCSEDLHQGLCNAPALPSFQPSLPPGCVCKHGWGGEDCSRLRCDPPCLNQGTCSLNTAGDRVCNCVAPFVGLACQTQACESQCSGHGRCLDRQCDCDAGWIGPSCQTELCPSACSNHGFCNSPRFSRYKAHLPSGCVCDHGFGGKDCATSNCGNQCGPHSTCIDNDCICDAGWIGLDCQTSLCVPPDCSGNGVCAGGDFDTVKCKCKPGFYGADCAGVVCTDACNGHGKCVDYKCMCDEGWAGRCDVEVCDPPCLFGRCVDRVCLCDSDHWGEACHLYRCPVDDCNGHGRCDHSVGLCRCQGGFSGAACQVFQEVLCMAWCEEECGALRHKGAVPTTTARGDRVFLSSKSCVLTCTTQQCRPPPQLTVGQHSKHSLPLPTAFKFGF